MKRTILIVDDSSLDRTVLRGFLREDYQVLEMDNSRDALVLLHAQGTPVCAVILDLSMPDMDGFAFMAATREDPLLVSLPILVATVSDDNETHERAVAAGANGFLLKPYSRSLLLHELHNVISLQEAAFNLNAMQRDKLTQLFNWEAFLSSAQTRIAAHEPGYFTLAYLNIDSFKVINDQHGTAVGDCVLQHIAQTLSECACEIGGVCCRVTADQFALLYPTEYEASEMIQRVHAAVSRPDCLDHGVKLRIGRYRVVDCAIPVSSMLDRAIMAADSIRGRFDTSFCTYNETMRQQMLHEQEIVSKMHDALNSGQFEVWYQPLIDHAAGTLEGAEALVRWRKPDGSLIPPGAFIPVFERNGFVYEVDKYVWEQVCKAQRAWLDDGRQPVPISVNISRYDVFCSDLTSVLKGLVEAYNLPFDLLRLEITESAFMETSGTIEKVVKELLKLGFVVEIDDFGTGYSSLNTLKDVPANVLKLDMRFFESTSDTQRSGSIVESVVRMARWLGMTVIAEGVEDQEQADFLKSIGCTLIQGYYYARPMPQPEFAQYAAQRQTQPQAHGLRTAGSFDNQAFWDPKSLDTMVFNHFSGGACIFEYCNGRYEMLRVNDEYARTLRTDMSTEEILHAELNADSVDKTVLIATIQRAAETGRSESSEIFTTMYSQQGEYIRFTIRRIAACEGRSLFYGYVENMTEQRIAEQRERKAERRQLKAAERLNTIINHIGDGISAAVLRDGKLHYLFANQTYFTQLGYTQEQYETGFTGGFDRIHPDDQAAASAAVIQASADEQPFSLQFRMCGADGKIRWILSKASVIHLPGVAEPVLLSVVSDISDRIETEDRLHFVNSLARTILTQPEHDKAISDSLRRVVAYCGAKRGYIVELCHKTGRATATYETCADGVNSALASFRNFPFDEHSFWYPTLSARKFYYLPDVSTLPSAYRSHRERYASLGITSLSMAPLWRDDTLIGFIALDSPTLVPVHPERLAVVEDYITLLLTSRDQARAAQAANVARRELLDHLPCGAALYDCDGKTIRAVHINRRYWELVQREPTEFTAASVLDKVHPDDQPAVLREVGAAIREERNICMDFRVLCGDDAYQAFHATANVSPAADGHFLLYTTYTPIQRMPQARAAQATAQSLPCASDRPTVLVVDDNAMERALVSAFLEERYHILTFDSGEEALSYLRSNCAQVAAIVLDILMPGMDGFAVMTRLRTDPALAPIPIIVSTGLEDDETRERAIAYGANGFVTKPYNRALLLHAVENAVQLRKMVELSEQAKAEEQQRKLLDHLPCGASLLEYDGQRVIVRHINRSYWKLVGRPPVDAAKLNIFDAIHPDDRLIVDQEIQSAIRQQRIAEADIRLLSGGGRYRPFHVAAKILCEDNGKYALFASYSPIAEQTMSVQEMISTALSTMMSSSGDYAFVKDKDSRYISCSRAVLEMNQLHNAREILGKTDEDLFGPELAAKFSVNDRHVMETGEALVDSPAVMMSPNGLIFVKSSLYPIIDAMGSVIGIYGVSRDVTTEKKLTFEFNTLMYAIPSGIFKYAADEAAQFEYINRNFIEELGYTEESFQAKFHNSFREMIYWEDRAAAEAEILRQESDGAIGKFDYRIEAADGTLRWYHDEGMRITDQDGKSWYYVTVVDITEDREAYAQLKLMTDTIPSGLATYVCTAQGVRISFCNSGFCEIFDISEERDISKIDPLSHIHTADCAEVTAQFHTLVERDVPLDCTFRIVLHNGALRWIHQRAVVSERRNDTIILTAVLFDVTEQHKAEERLRMSEEENRLAIAHSGKIVARYDVEQRTLTMPESMTPIFQVPHILRNMPEEQITLGRISPETAVNYRELFHGIQAGRPSGTITYQQSSTQGWRWLEAQYTTIFSDSGKPMSAVITFTDITEQLEKELVYSKWQQSLTERPSHSYTLLRCNLSKASSFESCEGTLLELPVCPQSETFRALTRLYAQRVYSEDRAQYLSITNADALLAGYYRGRRSDMLEFREVLPDGGIRWLRLTLELVEYPNSKDVEVYLMHEDITKDKLAELQSKELAETDPLTGVLNRMAFVSHMEQRIAKAAPGELHALLMLDIDEFKQVNDTYGHDAGDAVLHSLTDQTRAILRKDDLLGRLGGDEFLVFLQDVPDAAAAARKAQQICSLDLCAPGAASRITLSVGIVMLPEHGKTFDTLYKKVDTAMYQQKEAGKNGFHFAI